MVLMSIGKFAKELGVTTTQVRTMHKTGELIPARISDGGTRYYSEQQLAKLLNNFKPKEDERTVAYCRVSTSSQKDDLETQVANVKSYMYAKGYSFSVITDIGSGINYKNKGLRLLVKQITNKEVDRVVILYRDRLVRFGFELIEYLCELNGVALEVIDNSERSKEEELTDDLIQIITVFANRLYGSRSKRTKDLIQGVTDATRGKDSSVSD